MVNTMKFQKNRRGVLAFEWLMVVAILVVGIVGGVTVMRNICLTEIDDTISVVNQIDAEFVEP